MPRTMANGVVVEDEGFLPHPERCYLGRHGIVQQQTLQPTERHPKAIRFFRIGHNKSRCSPRW